jgi:hypothetical protein
VQLFQTRITLTDEFAPAVKSFDSQFLAATEPLKGSYSARIDAEDRGSGLAETVAIVDGVAQTPTRVVDAPCQLPYMEFRPCPRERTMAAEFDTSRVADGPHALSFGVRDAAGNETRTDPMAITVNNSPGFLPAIGSTATLRVWFTGKSRLIQRTLPFGRRATVEGVLTDAGGLPVGNAPLKVTERAIGVASKGRPGPALRTDAKGRFSYKPAAGPSRVIEVSYGAATARVTVRVRAGVTLRTSRKLVRNGTALRFSGRVLGQRGTRRALVTIYALTGGTRPRVPVETVRAGSDGRFTYRYRFARIAGPSVYRFEARVPKQTGFPYLEGASSRVTVRGRP